MTDEMRDDGHEPATRRQLWDVSVRLEGMDARLDGMDVRLDDMGVRLYDVCVRLDGHDRRLESIDGNLRRLNIGFARMEGDMTEVKGKIDLLLVWKSDFSKFATGMERMANYFESCVRKLDSQGSMLMEHESRITKLESRPS